MVKRTIQLFTTPHSNPRVYRKATALAAELRKNGATVLHRGNEAHPLMIADEADLVCAIGGDGTLRYVVDAVRKRATPVPIGIFPAGTINLVARERSSPRNARDFARRLLGDAGTPLRIGLINETPLLVCASVGPDSYAVERISLRLKRWIGRTAYGLAAAQLLFRWPRPTIRVTHEGGSFACEAIYVAKGQFYAGPWSFAPEAALGKAMLHIVALESASRWRFFRFVLQLLLHRPVTGLKGVRQFECTALTIEGSSGVPMQSDGDALFHLPVSITLNPAALDLT